MLKRWIDPSLNLQLILNFFFFSSSVFNILNIVFSTPVHPIALIEPSNSRKRYSVSTNKFRFEL